MKEEITDNVGQSQPPVVIDGRNVAGSAIQESRGWAWDRVTAIANYHLNNGSETVIAVIPCWEKDLKKSLLELGVEVVPFQINNDNEIDDRIILGLASTNNGYIITNDTSMPKHLGRGPIDREWFANSNIRFQFVENKYIPNFPSS
jgi:hypothetical protein